MAKIATFKVADPRTRQLALQVVDQVYVREKNWIHNLEAEIPPDFSPAGRHSWFLATVGGQPAGVLRLFYDPPLVLPADYQVTLRHDVDLARIAQSGRFVEIGRFMILPDYRHRYLVAIRLMGAAVREVLERQYTHFITDVFDGEPHSPLKFHTSILGFEIIGSHVRGELNCSLTRIILTLDIVKAYRRLKERRYRLWRSLFGGLPAEAEKRLAA